MSNNSNAPDKSQEYNPPPECFTTEEMTIRIALQLLNLDLSVAESAGYTHQDVKRAYRRVSLIVHPDKSSDPNATAKFQRVNSANTYLLAQSEPIRYFPPSVGLNSNQYPFASMQGLFARAAGKNAHRQAENERRNREEYAQRLKELHKAAMERRRKQEEERRLREEEKRRKEEEIRQQREMERLEAIRRQQLREEHLQTVLKQNIPSFLRLIQSDFLEVLCQQCEQHTFPISATSLPSTQYLQLMKPSLLQLQLRLQPSLKRFHYQIYMAINEYVDQLMASINTMITLVRDRDVAIREALVSDPHTIDVNALNSINKTFSQQDNFAKNNDSASLSSNGSHVSSTGGTDGDDDDDDDLIVVDADISSLPTSNSGTLFKTDRHSISCLTPPLLSRLFMQYSTTITTIIAQSELLVGSLPVLQEYLNIRMKHERQHGSLAVAASASTGFQSVHQYAHLFNDLPVKLTPGLLMRMHQITTTQWRTVLHLLLVESYGQHTPRSLFLAKTWSNIRQSLQKIYHHFYEKSSTLFPPRLHHIKQSYGALYSSSQSQDTMGIQPDGGGGLQSPMMASHLDELPSHRARFQQYIYTQSMTTFLAHTMTSILSTCQSFVQLSINRLTKVVQSSLHFYYCELLRQGNPFTTTIPRSYEQWSTMRALAQSGFAGISPLHEVFSSDPLRDNPQQSLFFPTLHMIVHQCHSIALNIYVNNSFDMIESAYVKDPVGNPHLCRRTMYAALAHPDEDNDEKQSSTESKSSNQQTPIELDADEDDDMKDDHSSQHYQPQTDVKPPSAPQDDTLVKDIHNILSSSLPVDDLSNIQLLLDDNEVVPDVSSASCTTAALYAKLSPRSLFTLDRVYREWRRTTLSGQENSTKRPAKPCPARLLDILLRSIFELPEMKLSPTKRVLTRMELSASLDRVLSPTNLTVGGSNHTHSHLTRSLKLLLIDHYFHRIDNLHNNIPHWEDSGISVTMESFCDIFDTPFIVQCDDPHCHCHYDLRAIGGSYTDHPPSSAQQAAGKAKADPFKTPVNWLLSFDALPVLFSQIFRDPTATSHLRSPFACYAYTNLNENPVHSTVPLLHPLILQLVYLYKRSTMKTFSMALEFGSTLHHFATSVQHVSIQPLDGELSDSNALQYRFFTMSDRQNLLLYHILVRFAALPVPHAQGLHNSVMDEGFHSNTSKPHTNASINFKIATHVYTQFQLIAALLSMLAQIELSGSIHHLKLSPRQPSTIDLYPQRQPQTSSSSSTHDQKAEILQSGYRYSNQVLRHIETLITTAIIEPYHMTMKMLAMVQQHIFKTQSSIPVSDLGTKARHSRLTPSVLSSSPSESHTQEMLVPDAIPGNHENQTIYGPSQTRGTLDEDRTLRACSSTIINAILPLPSLIPSSIKHCATTCSTVSLHDRVYMVNHFIGGCNTGRDNHNNTPSHGSKSWTTTMLDFLHILPPLSPLTRSYSLHQIVDTTAYLSNGPRSYASPVNIDTNCQQIVYLSRMDHSHIVEHLHRTLRLLDPMCPQDLHLGSQVWNHGRALEPSDFPLTACSSVDWHLYLSTILMTMLTPLSGANDDDDNDGSTFYINPAVSLLHTMAIKMTTELVSMLIAAGHQQATAHTQVGMFPTTFKNTSAQSSRPSEGQSGSDDQYQHLSFGVRVQQVLFSKLQSLGVYLLSELEASVRDNLPHTIFSLISSSSSLTAPDDSFIQLAHDRIAHLLHPRNEPIDHIDRLYFPLLTSVHSLKAQLLTLLVFPYFPTSQLTRGDDLLPISSILSSSTSFDKIQALTNIFPTATTEREQLGAAAAAAANHTTPQSCDTTLWYLQQLLHYCKPRGPDPSSSPNSGGSAIVSVPTPDVPSIRIIADVVCVRVPTTLQTMSTRSTPEPYATYIPLHILEHILTYTVSPVFQASPTASSTPTPTTLPPQGPTMPPTPPLRSTYSSLLQSFFEFCHAATTNRVLQQYYTRTLSAHVHSNTLATQYTTFAPPVYSLPPLFLPSLCLITTPCLSEKRYSKRPHPSGSILPSPHPPSSSSSFQPHLTESIYRPSSLSSTHFDTIDLVDSVNITQLFNYISQFSHDTHQLKTFIQGNPGIVPILEAWMQRNLLPNITLDVFLPHHDYLNDVLVVTSSFGVTDEIDNVSSLRKPTFNQRFTLPPVVSTRPSSDPTQHDDGHLFHYSTAHLYHLDHQTTLNNPNCYFFSNITSQYQQQQPQVDNNGSVHASLTGLSSAANSRWGGSISHSAEVLIPVIPPSIGVLFLSLQRYYGMGSPTSTLCATKQPSQHLDAGMVYTRTSTNSLEWCLTQCLPMILSQNSTGIHHRKSLWDQFHDTITPVGTQQRGLNMMFRPTNNSKMTWIDHCCKPFSASFLSPYASIRPDSESPSSVAQSLRSDSHPSLCLLTTWTNVVSFYATYHSIHTQYFLLHSDHHYHPSNHTDNSATPSTYYASNSAAFAHRFDQADILLAIALSYLPELYTRRRSSNNHTPSPVTQLESLCLPPTGLLTDILTAFRGEDPTIAASAVEVKNIDMKQQMMSSITSLTTLYSSLVKHLRQHVVAATAMQKPSAGLVSFYMQRECLEDVKSAYLYSRALPDWNVFESLMVRFIEERIRHTPGLAQSLDPHNTLSHQQTPHEPHEQSLPPSPGITFTLTDISRCPFHDISLSTLCPVISSFYSHSLLLERPLQSLPAQQKQGGDGQQIGTMKQTHRLSESQLAQKHQQLALPWTIGASHEQMASGQRAVTLLHPLTFTRSHRVNAKITQSNHLQPPSATKTGSNDDNGMDPYIDQIATGDTNEYIISHRYYEQQQLFTQFNHMAISAQILMQTASHSHAQLSAFTSNTVDVLKRRRRKALRATPTTNTVYVDSDSGEDHQVDIDDSDSEHLSIADHGLHHHDDGDGNGDSKDPITSTHRVSPTTAGKGIHRRLYIPTSLSIEQPSNVAYQTQTSSASFLTSCGSFSTISAIDIETIPISAEFGHDETTKQTERELSLFVFVAYHHWQPLPLVWYHSEKVFLEDPIHCQLRTHGTKSESRQELLTSLPHTAVLPRTVFSPYNPLKQVIHPTITCSISHHVHVEPVYSRTIPDDCHMAWYDKHHTTAAYDTGTVPRILNPTLRPSWHQPITTGEFSTLPLPSSQDIPNSTDDDISSTSESQHVGSHSCSKTGQYTSLITALVLVIYTSFISNIIDSYASSTFSPRNAVNHDSGSLPTRVMIKPRGMVRTMAQTEILSTIVSAFDVPEAFGLIQLLSNNNNSDYITTKPKAPPSLFLSTHLYFLLTWMRTIVYLTQSQLINPKARGCDNYKLEYDSTILSSLKSNRLLSSDPMLQGLEAGEMLAPIRYHDFLMDTSENVNLPSSVSSQFGHQSAPPGDNGQHHYSDSPSTPSSSSPALTWLMPHVYHPIMYTHLVTGGRLAAPQDRGSTSFDAVPLFCNPLFASPTFKPSRYHQPHASFLITLLPSSDLFDLRWKFYQTIDENENSDGSQNSSRTHTLNESFLSLYPHISMSGKYANLVDTSLVRIMTSITRLQQTNHYGSHHGRSSLQQMSPYHHHGHDSHLAYHASQLCDWFVPHDITAHLLQFGEYTPHFTISPHVLYRLQLSQSILQAISLPNHGIDSTAIITYHKQLTHHASEIASHMLSTAQYSLYYASLSLQLSRWLWPVSMGASQISGVNPRTYAILASLRSIAEFMLYLASNPLQSHDFLVANDPQDINQDTNSLHVLTPYDVASDYNPTDIPSHAYLNLKARSHMSSRSFLPYILNFSHASSFAATQPTTVSLSTLTTIVRFTLEYISTSTLIASSKMSLSGAASISESLFDIISSLHTVYQIAMYAKFDLPSPYSYRRYLSLHCKTPQGMGLASTNHTIPSPGLQQLADKTSIPPPPVTAANLCGFGTALLPVADHMTALLHHVSSIVNPITCKQLVESIPTQATHQPQHTRLYVPPIPVQQVNGVQPLLMLPIPTHYSYVAGVTMDVGDSQQATSVAGSTATDTAKSMDFTIDNSQRVALLQSDYVIALDSIVDIIPFYTISDLAYPSSPMAMPTSPVRAFLEDNPQEYQRLKSRESSFCYSYSLVNQIIPPKESTLELKPSCGFTLTPASSPPILLRDHLYLPNANVHTLRQFLSLSILLQHFSNIRGRPRSPLLFSPMTFTQEWNRRNQLHNTHSWATPFMVLGAADQPDQSELSHTRDQSSIFQYSVMFAQSLRDWSHVCSSPPSSFTPTIHSTVMSPSLFSMIVYMYTSFFHSRYRSHITMLRDALDTNNINTITQIQWICYMIIMTNQLVVSYGLVTSPSKQQTIEAYLKASLPHFTSITNAIDTNSHFPSLIFTPKQVELPSIPQSCFHGEDTPADAAPDVLLPPRLPSGRNGSFFSNTSRGPPPSTSISSSQSFSNRFTAGPSSQSSSSPPASAPHEAAYPSPQIIQQLLSPSTNSGSMSTKPGPAQQMPPHTEIPSNILDAPLPSIPRKKTTLSDLATYFMKELGIPSSLPNAAASTPITSISTLHTNLLNYNYYLMIDIMMLLQHYHLSAPYSLQTVPFACAIQSSQSRKGQHESQEVNGPERLVDISISPLSSSYTYNHQPRVPLLPILKPSMKTVQHRGNNHQHAIYTLFNTASETLSQRLQHSRLISQTQTLRMRTATLTNTYQTILQRKSPQTMISSNGIMTLIFYLLFLCLSANQFVLFMVQYLHLDKGKPRILDDQMDDLSPSSPSPSVTISSLQQLHLHTTLPFTHRVLYSLYQSLHMPTDFTTYFRLLNAVTFDLRIAKWKSVYIIPQVIPKSSSRLTSGGGVTTTSSIEDKSIISDGEASTHPHVPYQSNWLCESDDEDDLLADVIRPHVEAAPISQPPSDPSSALSSTHTNHSSTNATIFDSSSDEDDSNDAQDGDNIAMTDGDAEVSPHSSGDVSGDASPESDIQPPSLDQTQSHRASGGFLDNHHRQREVTRANQYNSLRSNKLPSSSSIIGMLNHSSSGGALPRSTSMAIRSVKPPASGSRLGLGEFGDSLSTLGTKAHGLRPPPASRRGGFNPLSANRSVHRPSGTGRLKSKLLNQTLVNVHPSSSLSGVSQDDSGKRQATSQPASSLPHAKPLPSAQSSMFLLRVNIALKKLIEQGSNQQSKGKLSPTTTASRPSQESSSSVIARSQSLGLFQRFIASTASHFIGSLLSCSQFNIPVSHLLHPAVFQVPLSPTAAHARGSVAEDTNQPLPTTSSNKLALTHLSSGRDLFTTVYSSKTLEQLVTAANTLTTTISQYHQTSSESLQKRQVLQDRIIQQYQDLIYCQIGREQHHGVVLTEIIAKYSTYLSVLSLPSTEHHSVSSLTANMQAIASQDITRLPCFPLRTLSLFPVTLCRHKNCTSQSCSLGWSVWYRSLEEFRNLLFSFILPYNYPAFHHSWSMFMDNIKNSLGITPNNGRLTGFYQRLLKYDMNSSSNTKNMVVTGYILNYFPVSSSSFAATCQKVLALQQSCAGGIKSSSMNKIEWQNIPGTPSLNIMNMYKDYFTQITHIYHKYHPYFNAHLHRHASRSLSGNHNLSKSHEYNAIYNELEHILQAKVNNSSFYATDTNQLLFCLRVLLHYYSTGKLIIERVYTPALLSSAQLTQSPSTPKSILSEPTTPENNVIGTSLATLSFFYPTVSLDRTHTQHYAMGMTVDPYPLQFLAHCYDLLINRNHALRYAEQAVPPLAEATFSSDDDIIIEIGDDYSDDMNTDDISLAATDDDNDDKDGDTTYDDMKDDQLKSTNIHREQGIDNDILLHRINSTHNDATVITLDLDDSSSDVIDIFNSSSDYDDDTDIDDSAEFIIPKSQNSQKSDTFHSNRLPSASPQPQQQQQQPHRNQQQAPATWRHGIVAPTGSQSLPSEAIRSTQLPTALHAQQYTPSSQRTEPLKRKAPPPSTPIDLCLSDSDDNGDGNDNGRDLSSAQSNSATAVKRRRGERPAPSIFDDEEDDDDDIIIEL